VARRIWICWSWDYHQSASSNYKSPVYATNTIRKSLFVAVTRLSCGIRNTTKHFYSILIRTVWPHQPLSPATHDFSNKPALRRAWKLVSSSCASHSGCHDAHEYHTCYTKSLGKVAVSRYATTAAPHSVLRQWSLLTHTCAYIPLSSQRSSSLALQSTHILILRPYLQIQVLLVQSSTKPEIPDLGHRR